MQILEKISQNLKSLKLKKPLIHHITNYVTVNDCANIVLAIGGSPVMADDISEVSEMVSVSSALVLNIGTLNSRTIESMLKAGKKANKLNIPVILDPVGVGATTLRTKAAKKILDEVSLSVIRGNMSEIKILSGTDTKIKGVDSTADEKGGKEIAKNLAKKLSCIVAITGKTDVISDGSNLCLIENGHEMLADVTGTGCMATSLIGTFCGATNDYFIATAAGVMSMGLAGELAFNSLKDNEGTGTFKTRLFDNIFNLTSDTILKGGKIKYE